MTQKLYDEFSIQQIANSIRGRYEIYGTAPEDYKWKVSEMPAAINGLPSISESAEGVIGNTAEYVRISSATTVIPPHKFSPTSYDDWNIYSRYGGSIYDSNALRRLKCTEVRSIGDYAFYNSNVEEIETEASNTDILIYKDAFGKTRNIKRIIVDGVKYVGHIDNLSSDTLHIFAGSLSDPDTFISDAHHQFSEGDLVFNRDDGKCYKRENDSWTLFIPSSKFFASCEAFKSSAIEIIPLYLQAGFCHNTMYEDSSFYKSIFEGCTCLRTVYFASNFGAFDSYNRKGAALDSMFIGATGLRSIWIVDTTNQTLSDDVALLNNGVISARMFQSADIRYLNLSNVTYLDQYALAGSITNSELHLPALTTLKGSAIRENQTLEKLYLGDGTKAYVPGGADWNISRQQNLYELTLNYTAVPMLGSANGNDKASAWLRYTAFSSYLGETTTEITEGANAGNVTINGVSKATHNKGDDPGSIVTYGGKDWVRVSNKWTEWGTNGNKRPTLKFPLSQVNDVLGNARWLDLPALSQMVTSIEGT